MGLRGESSGWEGLGISFGGAAPQPRTGPGGEKIAVYRPEVFEVANEQQAMGIILTPEMGTTTAERWQKETAYLVEDIGKHLALTADSCVLDYGCGIGRVSKALIEAYGCRVVGVDFSRSMQLMAPGYVLSERFVIWSPEVLAKMVEGGFAADAAICLWVIQHVAEPAKSIAQIRAAIRDRGLLYSLNQVRRAVPTDRGWIDDRFDMRKGLAEAFLEEDFHTLPESATTAQLAGGSMIQVLRKRGGSSAG
jgi:SAM-dependent methyltransferase